MAVASILKSGNKYEKILATEFENDSNHNKNNRLKTLIILMYSIDRVV